MTEERMKYVVAVHEPIDVRLHPMMMFLTRPITFHPILARLTGSVTAAIMLQQAMYWMQVAGEKRNGWFFKNSSEWQQETTLTRDEQRTARRHLKKFSFWQEEMRQARGAPTLHYRVSLNELQRQLSLLVQSNGEIRPVDGGESHQSITESTTETTITHDDINISPDFQQQQQERADDIEPYTTSDIDGDDYSTLTFLADVVGKKIDSTLSLAAKDAAPPNEPPPPPSKRKAKHEPCSAQDKDVLMRVLFGHTNYGLMNVRLWSDVYAANDALVRGGIPLHQVLGWYNEVWTKTWPGNQSDRRPTQSDLLTGVGAYVARLALAAPAEEHVLLVDEEGDDA